MKYINLIVGLSVLVVLFVLMGTQASAPAPNTELVCTGNTMEHCLTGEEIITLHSRCVYEIAEASYTPETDYSTATFACDSIFWEYFCDLYPLNPKC